MRRSIERLALSALAFMTMDCYAGDNVTAPTPLVMNPMDTGRLTVVVAGTAAPSDSIRPTMSGDRSSIIMWSASRSSNWATLLGATGPSGEWLRWNRNASGLAPGLYVDTITVVVQGAAGSPRTVLDSMRITSAGIGFSH